MPKELSVLNIEDSKTDSARIAGLLKKAGYKTTFKRVETQAQMRTALKQHAWDVIISAYSLKQFDGYAALALLREEEQDIPFIAISGTIGEEAVVDMMQAGARDYLLKDNLARLIPAVERELEYTEARRERKLAQEALTESESRFRQVWETTSDAMALSDSKGIVLAVNPAYLSLYGYSAEKVIGHSFAIIFPQANRKLAVEQYKSIFASDVTPSVFEAIIKRADGTQRFVESQIAFITKAGVRVAMLSTVRDITDRKQVDDALVTNEKRFRALVENSLDDISLIAADGTLIWESPSVVRNLGYPPDELLGSNILELLHPDDSELIQNLFTELIQKPAGRQSGSFRLKRSDGTWRWVEAVATNMLNEPSVQAVVINYRDITERRNMEDEISIKDQNYRSVLAQASDGIFAINSSGKFIDVNPSGCAMLGYTLEELLAIKMVDLFPPADLAETPLRIDDLIQGKTVFSERRVIRKDGTLLQIEISARMVADGSFQGVMHDVTERKRMEDALAQSEYEHRTLFENVPVGLYRTSAEGYMLDANPAMIKIFGYQDLESFTAVKVENLYVDPSINKKFNDEMDKSDIIISMQAEFCKKDGTTFWAEDNIRAIRDEQGNPLFYEGSLVDITERKHAEQILAESEARYRQAIAAANAIPYSRNYASEHYTFIGEEITKLAGYPMEEITPALLNSQIVESVVQGKFKGMPLSEAVRRVREGESRALQCDLRIRSRSGDERWVSDSSIQVLDENNVPIGSVGILQDITERKRTDEILSESEARYRQAITAADAIPYSLEYTPGRYTYIGEGIKELAGYSFEEMSPDLLDSLIEESIMQGEFKGMPMREAVKLVREGKSGALWKCEHRIRTGSGEERWLSDSSIQILGEDGIPTGSIGIFQDITERKQAENKLLESERRYRELYANMPAMFFTIDAGGNTLTVNDYGAAQLGFIQEELLGQSVLKVFYEEDKEQAVLHVKNCLEHPNQTFQWELRKVRKDGSMLWVKETAWAVNNQQGEAIVLIVCEDITERKQAQEVVRGSEARYRSLFEDSPISLWEEDFSAVKLRLDALKEEGVRDFKTYFASHPELVLECISLLKIVDVNKATLKLFGAKEKSELLQDPSHIILTDPVEISQRKMGFADELISIAQGRSHFEKEAIHQTLDGRKLILRLSLSVMDGYEDTFSKVIVSMVDITGHIQAERTIRESERSLRESQTIAGLGSYVLDITTSTWTDSDILDQIFGIDETYSRSVEGWLDIIHEGWKREMAEYFANEILGNHIRFDKEYKITRKNDGAERWVHGLGELEFDDQNQPVKMRGTIQDITERKEVEEALRERESKLSALLEILPVGISIFDSENKVSYVNPALENILGLSTNDIQSGAHQNRTYFNSAGNPMLANEFASAVALQEQQPIHNVETGILKEDGSLTWTNVSAVPVDFPDWKLVIVTTDITERKQAEWSLRNSEGRYRALFEEMPISIWEEDFSEAKKYLDSLKESGVTDFPAYFKTHPESFLACATMIKIIDVNQATLKMYRAASKQDLYKSMDEGLSESEVEHMSQALIAIADGKINHSWDGPDETISGEPIEISLNWTVTPGHESDFSKVIVTTLDITERKHSEEAVQKSERRFRALIANAGDLIVVVNPNGVIQYASPSSENILGYKPEDTTGRKLSNWVHPDDLAAVLDSLASRNKETGVAPRSIKARGRHRDGTWRTLESIGTSLIHEPGIEGIVLNIRDITEREFAEEALRTSEAQFRAIFEGAAIGIALVDAEGYPVKHNVALEEMLGYSDLELRSMTFADFTHADDAKIDWALWQELIAGKRDHYEIEKRYIHKSGRIIWGKLVTSVVPNADGKILFGVGMVEDITDRKYREREQQAQASITQVINQGLDMDVLLQNLLDAAMHAVPLAEKGSILLLDAEGILRIRALNGYSDPRIRTASFPSTSGYSARSVREGRAFMIADAHADSPTRYNFEIKEMDAIQSAIVAPLIVKGSVIGAISLDNASRKEAFGSAELATLTTFASSAALVIQNTRLLDETNQRISELELLYESGLAISQLLSPKEIGEKIIDLLEQKMNWHHTAIRLYNAENETLELLAYHQPDLKSNAERLAVEARFKSMVSRPSEGLSGWVVQHGETLRTGNLKNDQRYVETFPGLHSGLYVPIKTGDRIIGVISIESEKENAFSRSDEQLTTILATQAASIFENARLYEDTFQRAMELEKRVSERTAQIETTKRRLELATHAGQIGVWEYNPRENKVIWDERMHLIYQVPMGEFDGTSQSWAKLIYPDDLEQSNINQQLAMTKNLLANNEYRIIWPDGSVRHMMASAVTAYAPDGTPERIIGINMDITERKQIEQSLRESETYARLLFDAVPDPVSVTEANGSIVDVNKVFEKQYQLVRDEIRGRLISELSIYPESELDKRESYLSEVLQGQMPNPVELDFYVPGDRIHTLELHSYPLEVNGRHLVLNTSHDITSHKKAEEAQRLAKSEMERALRIKNEFLANMSHELRTPLNSILGISESLEEQIAGVLNDKQLKYIGIVRESGRHLLELINDILDLSKIEAGRMELDIHHIYVDKLCLSSLRMVKELAQKKSLNISYIANEDVKVILGDERRLKQSLVNLLSNAVKFTAAGSRIGLEVYGTPEKNEVSFTVWDQGIGIAQKDIQHLFKPFVQLDAGLAREYQGTGLGLALVAQMVNLHGGRIELESEIKGGSRFTITLPWAPAEQATKAKVTSDLSLPGLISDKKGNGRILLVEDTDVVIQLISEYLRYKGYEIILAHNGVEGINLAMQEHPDLILMDVMMPIMNGLEATENIRKDEALKNTPIIALTALAMAGDSERCLAAGMNDYLSKPIQMQDLAVMIEKYMQPAPKGPNGQ